MGQAWDEHGNPISDGTPSQSWDESGKPISAHHMKGTLTGREAPKRSTAGDIADLIEGTGKVAAGGAAVAAPFAPVAALGAAAGGYLANKGGNAAAEMLGASPDTQRLSGDIAAIPGAMLGGEAAGPIGRFVGRAATAISDPAVLSKIPGASHVTAAKDALADAYRRAGATAIPDAPFSIANDPRPINGPVAPPPRVLRDASSPAWASFPGSSVRPTQFEPIRAELPSGRVPGPIAAPIPATPARVLPPLWSGVVSDSPDILPKPLSIPTASLPSGRVPGGIRNQQATGSPGTEAPIVPASSPASKEPDYSAITSQYKPSRTKARFDADGKRIGG